MSDYIVSPAEGQVIIGAEIAIHRYNLDILRAIQLQEIGIPGPYPPAYFPNLHQPQNRLTIQIIKKEFPALTKCL